MYPLAQVNAIEPDVHVKVLEAQVMQVWVETWKKKVDAQTVI